MLPRLLAAKEVSESLTHGEKKGAEIRQHHRPRQPLREGHDQMMPHGMMRARGIPDGELRGQVGRERLGLTRNHFKSRVPTRRTESPSMKATLKTRRLPSWNSEYSNITETNILHVHFRTWNTSVEYERWSRPPLFPSASRCLNHPPAGSQNDVHHNSATESQPTRFNLVEPSIPGPFQRDQS